MNEDELALFAGVMLGLMVCALFLILAVVVAR